MFNQSRLQGSACSKSGWLSGSNLQLVVFILFIVVCILYYFIRFQLGFDSEVIYFYLFLQCYISLFAFRELFGRFAEKLPLNSVDFMVVLFLLDSIYLTALTIARTPSIDSLLYALKDYLFPVLAFWYCRQFLKNKNWIAIYELIGIVLTVVSAVYMFDFINGSILGNETLEYRTAIRQLTMETTGATELTGTKIVGDEYTLVRYEGVLSHINVTGTAMGIGALLCLAVARARRSTCYYLMFILNSGSLMFAAPRTAILSTLIALVIYLWFTTKVVDIVNLKTVRRLALFLGIFWIFISYGMDLSAYEKLYDIQNVVDTWYYLWDGLPELEQLLVQIQNPLNWFGMGFAVPGNYDGSDGVVRSDDLFFVQLISMYGLGGVLFFFVGCVVICKSVIPFKEKSVVEMNHVIAMGLVIVIVLSVTVVHANVLTRPQLFPLFFVALASISVQVDCLANNKRI